MNMIEVATGFRELSALAREPYEPRGIFHSEMALVLGLCLDLDVEVVIESGRARAQSTWLLGKYLPDTEIHSIEYRRDSDALYGEERVRELPNVILHYGSAMNLVPTLVRENSGKRIAVLLDGPKGEPAVHLLKRSVMESDDVMVGFIHDMRKIDHHQPAAFRRLAQETFPRAFFSDEPAYVEATQYLDAAVFEIGKASNWKPYWVGDEYLGSYGPTLGVFTINDDDRVRLRG